MPHIELDAYEIPSGVSGALVMSDAVHVFRSPVADQPLEDDLGDYVFRDGGRHLEGLERPRWRTLPPNVRRELFRAAGYRARNNVHGDIAF